MFVVYQFKDDMLQLDVSLRFDYADEDIRFDNFPKKKKKKDFGQKFLHNKKRRLHPYLLSSSLDRKTKHFFI